MSLNLTKFACVLICCLFVNQIGCGQIVPATSGHQEPLQPLPAPAKALTFDAGTTSASFVVAGGCFWCMEAVFENVAGVTDVVSGYSGGTQETAQYKIVSRGESTHAEAIKITFDPHTISYAQLMQIFFTMHYPTQRDGQTPDIGRQYRSAVFYGNEEEHEFLKSYIQQLNDSKVFRQPIATSLEPLQMFYPAEDYHQDYVKKNPGDSYVLQWSVPKIEKLKKLFPERLKK